ncbi:MAG: DUF445 domain-containing protein [Candidatus Nanopelagicales bacterium]
MSTSLADQPTPPGSAAELWATTDAQKAGALRHMKRLATGLFGLAALIYLITVLTHGMNASGWVGYVQAGSEAGMVGALADWFAVTALFRHPLGLPIPHTAIIPTRKDQLGQGLGEFVGTHFLTDQVVREKVRSVQVARRAGEWLAVPANANRVAGELGRALRGAMAVLDDEQMRTMIQKVAAERVERFSVSPALGALLGHVVADGAHNGIVDVVADRARAWVVHNRAALAEIIVSQAPSWTPRLVDEMVADRLHLELVKFTTAIRDDPDHPVRASIDRMLTQFANDLRENPTTRERVEAAKNDLFNQPDVQRAVADVWGTAQLVLLEAADDPESELRQRAAGALASAGATLAADQAIQLAVDAWVEDTAAHLVGSYRGELAGVISETVSRWDGADTANRIELAAGRDLQFIRINGTVVGALAGVAIHGISTLL